GDDLHTPDLVGPAGEGEPEGADAAEEVEDALGAGQAGLLGGDPVEPLSHLRVGLEEGSVGDPEAKAAEFLLQEFGAERPGAHSRRAAGTFGDGVQVDGRAGDLRGRGDEAALELAGAPPLADHEVAEDPSAGAPF